MPSSFYTYLPLYDIKGFHDVCSILLIILGKEGAIKAGKNIAMFLLRYPLILCAYDYVSPAND
jgi:hypothetical protein